MNKKGGLKSLLARVEKEKSFSLTNVKYSLLEYDFSEEEILGILKYWVKKLEFDSLTRTERNRMTLDFFALAFSKPERAAGVFHPSEISTENPICKRKMYFQVSRLEIDPLFIKEVKHNNQLQRLFDLGTMVHLYIQSSLYRAKLLEDFEVPVQNFEHGIDGSADGIIKRISDGKLFGLEIKTINSYGFNSLKQPKAEHLKQATIYFGFLGVHDIIFIYYCKDNSAFKEYIVSVDESYLEEIKSLTSEIVQSYQENYKATGGDLSKHLLPKREVCGSRTSERALSCPYANNCFQLH